MDLGRPAEVIHHIRGTFDNVVPARLRTWLAAAEAEASATLGDEKTCRDALDKTADLLPEGDTDPELPYLVLNRHHLARWRGSCLVHFGDPKTVEDLKSALAGMGGTFNRAEAGLGGRSRARSSHHE